MPHYHHCVLLARWWAGEWQLCSKSCGLGGLSRRTVLCIRSVGLDEQRALEPLACAHLPRPLAETPCNHHVPCPSTWGVGNWSQVSVRRKGNPGLVPPLPQKTCTESLLLVTWGGREPGAFLGQHCLQSRGDQEFLGMLTIILNLKSMATKGWLRPLSL